MENILDMAKKSLNLLYKQKQQLKLTHKTECNKEHFNDQIDELNHILKLTGKEIDNQNKQLTNYSFDK